MYQLGDYKQKALGHVGKGSSRFHGVICRQGFENPEDGLNVGLHEMAHALYLSSVEKGWNLELRS